MEWWDRVVILPARRVWLGMASRLGIRKTGLGKLRKQVRSCEYEDVRIMWELLSGPERKKSTTTGRVLAAFHWPPYNLCSTF
ncbi:hypothetical protein J5N97_008529 [Dioscorea zingiberensis]|uniref:Uncharacterized protein n=1 Tax=Dioscorea zingiberensis TaxID=325984 RepID=A0A9D5CWB3_9LILI|nr:hypothetical protein J5N97_008529 [Dioscorea zingiberensis]